MGSNTHSSNSSLTLFPFEFAGAELLLYSLDGAPVLGAGLMMLQIITLCDELTEMGLDFQY